MAIIDFGGVKEEVVTREEFPLSKAKEVLKNEVVAILGYGPQGYGQSLNMRDAGINVIVGQRKGGKGWDDAVKDGWVEGKNLFSKIEDAVDKATIIQYLLSDAGQKEQWPLVKQHLKKGQALYFSHGFSIVFKEQTNVIPPPDVDVVLVAPKGSGRTVRSNYLAGSGINASFAVYQDATGHARERAIACGIAIGSGLSVSHDVRTGSDQRPHRRARRADGGNCRYHESTGRCPSQDGTHAERSLQRNRRGSNAKLVPTRRCTWDGLDVCGMQYNSPAGRARLVEEIRGHYKAAVRASLSRCSTRRGNTASARNMRRTRLPRKVDKRIGRVEELRNVESGGGCAEFAA